MQQTDIELLIASRAGDADAFGRLVRRYQSLAWTVALGVTGDPALSEEIAQEAFVTAWTELPRLREPDKFPAWLCGMVRNLARYARRHQRRHAPGVPAADDARQRLAGLPSPEPSPLDQAISRQQQAVLRDALDAIPETYRLPLLLFYSERRSLEQVARSLDLSEQTVKQRLCRGRKYLKRSVEHRLAGAIAASAPKAGLGAALWATISLSAERASAAVLSSVPRPWLATAQSTGLTMTSALAVTAIVLTGLSTPLPGESARPLGEEARAGGSPAKRPRGLFKGSQREQSPRSADSPYLINKKPIPSTPFDKKPIPSTASKSSSPHSPSPSNTASIPSTASRPAPGESEGSQRGQSPRSADSPYLIDKNPIPTPASRSPTPDSPYLIDRRPIPSTAFKSSSPHSPSPSNKKPIPTPASRPSSPDSAYLIEQGPSAVTRVIARPGPSLSWHDVLGALPPSRGSTRSLPIEPPDLRDRIQAPDL